MEHLGLASVAAGQIVALVLGILHMLYLWMAELP